MANITLFAQEALFAVSCVTRDMAPNYDWVARELFPNAYQVADKFHVVKNIIDQVQSVRIRYRQELLRKQRELEEASRKQPKLLPDPKIQREFKDLKKELSNGDTQLQLLQRSKGLLHKLPTSQMEVRCPVAVSKSIAIKSNLFITLRLLARSMP